ncbi:response regulator [Muricoccus radiodurans]|uniref:response regulator n=1 Tax=Muricoccus radiodurans TaxID=2231721 RepID=UPI003CEF0F5A
MPSAASMRVLVVDDQQSMRLLVRDGLTKLGFTDVDEAGDGEDGLRRQIANPAQLVIADFNMPKLDGIALLRAIRLHPPTSKTAYIMLTGRADKDLVQKAVQFGVNNYIVKPFTVETLREKIEAVFGPLT